MGFGNALFLWGLLGAGLPVLIHLAGRRKATVLRFPSVRFLSAVDRAAARRFQIRHWIVLALRTAACGAVALGLSLPRLAGPGAAVGERRRSTAVIVDTGITMRSECSGVTVLRRAKEVLKHYIEGLGKAERACCFNAPAAAFTTDHAAVIQDIDRLQAGFGHVDLQASCERAAESLAQEDTTEKHLVVVSDFRRWSLPRASVSIPEGIQISACCLRPDPGPNLCFESFRAAAPSPQDRKMRLSVANTGSCAAQGILRVFSGEKPLLTRPVSVPAGGVVSVPVSLSPKERGSFTAEVSAPGDVLAADNKAFAVLRARQVVRVLLLGEGEVSSPWLDPAYYLASALSVPGARAHLRRASVANVPDLARFDVVWCVALPAISDSLAAALRSFVRQGGTVVFVPGEGIDVSSYRRLCRAPEAFLCAVPSGFQKTEGARIAQWDRRHPVVRRLEALDPPCDMQAATFSMVLHLEEITPPTVCLLRLDSGAPLLLERPFGRGKVLLFATGLTPSWSTLPLRVLFLPLVDSILAESAVDRLIPATLSCGSSLVLGERFGSARIRGPAGEVPVERSTEGICFGPFTRPGLYEAVLEGDSRYLVAVNVPWAGKEAAFLSYSEIKKRLGASYVVEGEDPLGLSAAIEGQQRGRELRNLFLGLFLLCLLLEGFLAGRWARRK